MEVLAQGRVHHRRAGDGVLIWPLGTPPLTVEGLAAEAWELLARAQTIAELRDGIMGRHGSSDPALDAAISTSIELLRPYLEVQEVHSAGTGPSTATGPPRADPELRTGSMPVLLRWTQVVPPEGAAAMSAAQHSIGRPPPDEVHLTWPAINRCSRERVLPGLAGAHRRGALELGATMTTHLQRMDHEAQIHSIRCEQALVHVIGCLTELGVEHRVLKGLATAHLDFADPGLRQIGDVDLLVDATDHPAVVDRLRAEGYRHIVGGDPGPFTLYKSNYLVGPGNVEIDLHHRLFRHGRAPGRSLWDDGTPFAIAGTPLMALNRPWRLVHAAAHAMFSGGGSGRLSMFLDPARIVLEDPAVLEEAMSIAERLHLRRLVATGIRRSCEMLGAPAQDLVGPARLPRHRGSSGWRDTVAMWAFDSPERHVAREQLSLLGGLSTSQAVRWLAAWVRPSEEYQGESLARRLVSRVRSRSRAP